MALALVGFGTYKEAVALTWREQAAFELIVEQLRAEDPMLGRRRRRNRLGRGGAALLVVIATVVAVVVVGAAHTGADPSKKALRCAHVRADTHSGRCLGLARSSPRSSPV